MCKAKVLLVIVFIFSIASVSHAFNVIYVDVNGPNEPGTGSYEDPFRRIQDGLDSADSNDTVIITEGVYTGNGNYDLDPNGKSIIIRSTEPNDPEIVANTIIDPNGAGRGFYFHSGEDANCMVLGLTIRNAFFNGDGGAIGCDGSSPVIKNCIIINNQSRYGGGIGTIDAGSPTLINCTIAKNSAYFSGGGIYCFGSHTTIKNCIIRQNDGSEGHQVGIEYQSSTSIAYTDIQDGQEGVSSIESTLYWLSGNIDADPCFASFDPNGDPNVWDFHLQSAYGRWEPNSQSWVTDANTSVCIDAGDPNSDWNREPWPNGKRINMGAYGGTAQASMNGNPADFDISGSVNFVDFAEFSDKWLARQNCIEDLNRDGVVDFADVRIFAKNWLWQQQ